MELKRVIVILLAALLLFGCSADRSLSERPLRLRAALLAANGCSFDAQITADYGQEKYTFAMGCTFDAHGNLSFTVREPQTIAGITGTMDAQGGKLTFDDHALAFPMLADGQATPIAAPWLMYRALCSGCITSCAAEDSLVHVQVDDSYADDALQLDVWLGTGEIPQRAEILYENRRILTVLVENFRLL